MLTTEQIRAHLERLSYKPGWAFEVYDGRFEGHHIRIVGRVENSYRPGQHVHLGINSHLSPLQSTDELETWLAWRLARIETHEAREWLKRDGVPVFDPHAEGAGDDR